MKTTELILKRLRKDRPKASVSLQLPVEVIDDLKQIAPILGFINYHSLIRAYIGAGLRVDLARLDTEKSQFASLIASLRRHGVSEEIIAEAFAETRVVAQSFH